MIYDSTMYVYVCPNVSVGECTCSKE